MKRIKQKDDANHYSILQNIMYCFANVYRWDKSFYLGFIPKIFLSVLLPLAMVYFPRVLIDMIDGNFPAYELVIFIAVFCALFALLDMASVFTEAKLSSMGGVFSTIYDRICTIKYLMTDYQNTESPKIRDLYNNAKSKVNEAESIVDSLSNLFVGLLGIIVSGSIIAMLDPLILAAIIICTIASFYMLKIVRSYTHKNWQKWASIDRKVWYLFSMNYAFEKVKDNKLYPYPKLINQMTDQCHKERIHWHKKVWNREALPSIGEAILAILRNGLVYFILIRQVLNGYIDVGLFVFFFGAVTYFSGWLSGIVSQFNDILKNAMNVNFIRSFLEIPDKFNRSQTVKPSSSAETAIEIKNLSFKYTAAENSTIKNISTKIRKGEKIALVGANGAGKTTLVKLLCGLYYPSDGDILLNGTSIRDINIYDYYKLFSVVFQDAKLFPCTIAQYVSGSGIDVDRAKVKQCLKMAGLYDRIKKCAFGIDTTFYRNYLHEDPGIDLSGGERQKLALARALYKDAPFLILDEPTASLDPIAENETYQRFHQLTKDKTAIYISHRLASTHFCDRIFFMDSGQITEWGSHNELMALKGMYYEMFEIQSHYYKDDISKGVMA